MAQAKRRKSASNQKTRPKIRLSLHSLGMLAAGVVIGCLGTILWQGLHSRNGEIGSGIRQIIANSEQQTVAPNGAPVTPTMAPAPQSTSYDFFTVLPEIKVAAPTEHTVAATTPSSAPKPPATAKTAVAVAPQPQSAFMLQAGAYNRQADADRQKQALAFLGLSSVIQQVTRQGRGDVFIVRLGPFTEYAQMVQADQRLQQQGIKALRLKISKGG